MSDTSNPQTNKEAKARADTYAAQQQSPSDPAPDKPRPRRSPDEWRNLVDQRIEEAMAQGAFDNLRNKGKPLDPAPNPFTPADMQMANSLLRNNDLVPAWIADRNEILGAIDRLRASVQRTAGEFRAAKAAVTSPQHEAQLHKRWTAQLALWRDEIRQLNKRIEIQNLRQPVTFLEIFKLDLDLELEKAERC